MHYRTTEPSERAFWREYAADKLPREVWLNLYEAKKPHGLGCHYDSRSVYGTVTVQLTANHGTSRGLCICGAEDEEGMVDEEAGKRRKWPVRLEQGEAIVIPARTMHFVPCVTRDFARASRLNIFF